uniref:Yip1 domain-containing protein n=1 Tax=mine drainage metagenome TaxID=410659 RepID=E6Q1R1_9ZZZZ
MTTAPPPQENAGLTSLIETIVAPASAFDRLAEKQTWGWAFIASSVLTAVGALASGRYLSQLMMEHKVAAATTPQQAAAAANIGKLIEKFSTFRSLAAPLEILWLILVVTVILFIFNAIFGGKATFKQLWCAAMNASIVVAVGALLGSIAMVLRGADSATNLVDFYRDTITLAAVIPTANVKVLGFLASISPFALWQIWLNALIMQRIARLAAPKAWAAALAVFFLPLVLIGSIILIGSSSVSPR